MKVGWQPRKWLTKKAKAGVRGYPVGTIAFYGPDSRRATKAVAGIVTSSQSAPTELRKWFAEEGDIRVDRTFEEIAAFLREHGVRSVAMADRIFGCPHEEGIDYPMGEKCPRCPFWADRDRFGEDVPA